MDTRPIGVFDSGVGGLTVVKQIMKVMPHENIVYFGDTARVPYGTKSKEAVTKYSKQNVRFLLSKEVKAIIVACNTASSNSLDALRETFDVPIFGVVVPGVEEALRSTKNKKIGVIGTPGTVRSGAYERMICEQDSEMQVFTKACPLFVPLAEEGWTDNEVSRQAAKRYLEELVATGIDSLVLGCTHYPLIEKVIREYMGDDVTLINSGAEVAKYLKKKLTKENLLHDGKCDENQYRYYVSDDISSFEELGGIFLEREINGQVNKIDIEKY